MKANTTVIASVVAILVVSAAVVGGALSLLRAPSGQPEAGGEVASASNGAASNGSAPIAPRPDCRAASVAGVALPCLGGQAAGQETGLRVINVWAWWCEPCREELPIFAEFAQRHPEIDVAGVHADANAANGAALLNELGVDLPSYQDDTGVFAGTLGLPAVVPLTLVVRDGQQVAVLPRTFDSVEALEEAVL